VATRKTITRERTKATWKCRWRPNRSKERRYTEQDAARIMCRVVRSGGTKAEIERRYAVVCRGQEDRRTPAEEAIALAQAAILGNNAALTDAFTIFVVINGILGVIALLTRFVPSPPLKAVALGIGLVRTNITTVMTTINRQKAANDALYQNLSNVLRRAA